MSDKIVAVTMRLANAQDYDEPRDAISHDWLRLLASLGVTPVLVPNRAGDANAYLHRLGVQAVLLTNGDSLGPRTGEAGGPAPSARDELEWALLDSACDLGLPVLGVCRGLQAINVYFGGGITRDLAAATGENHVARMHTVTALPDGHRFEVNSFHGEGVLAHQLAEGLVASAQSMAGVVEALHHESLPVRAVQWHPERPGAPAEEDEALFEWWLGA